MAYSPSPRDELRLLTNNVRAYVEALGVWGVQHIPVDQPPARTSPASQGDARLSSDRSHPPLPEVPMTQRFQPFHLQRFRRYTSPWSHR